MSVVSFRLACVLCLSGLMACSSSTVSLSLNSSESTTALRQGLAGSDSLTRAQQVHLTVASVALYLTSGTPDLNGMDPARDSGWLTFSDTLMKVDLMTVRGEGTKFLGEGLLSDGTLIRQVRLRLVADEPGPEGFRRVRDAIIDQDRKCDLLLPESAVFPGLTLPDGAALGSNGQHLDLVLSVRLDDAILLEDNGGDCTWQLNPGLMLRARAPAGGTNAP